MELSVEIIEAIEHAESKAFATTGKDGINVVPVSVVRVVDGSIWLMNFFFKKTLENILEEPNVAFVCWKGLDGYQIKGSVVYLDSGEVFDGAKAWITANIPNRTLKGLLILTPKSVYNIAPK